MEITSDVKIGIGMLVATVLIIAGGAYFNNRRGNPAVDTTVYDISQLKAENSPTLGATDPKVTIVEFGDFECPACGVLHPVLKQLKQEYEGKAVQFVYRHFPLAQHQHAHLAAQAATEAQAQGKFWEYHDSLFEHQNNLTRADLEKYAADLGLDMEKFKSALDQKTHADSVNADISAGGAVGVQGTPTIFINGARYGGQYSVTAMKAIIDPLLQ